MSHHLFKVSCKCAIFSSDGKKVLLAEYGPNDYGLPGGHIDEGETPDEAMRRELKEELGLTTIEFNHADFFIHHNGKLILGFTAQLDEATLLTIQLDEISAAVWEDVTAIATGDVKVPSYKDFILQNQP